MPHKSPRQWRNFSAGPTTSVRMDAYAPRLMEKGLRGMIGKGYRSAEVVEARAATSTRKASGGIDAFDLENNNPGVRY